MKAFPEGKERKLEHVFSVAYPLYPESLDVLDGMDAFFLSPLSDKNGLNINLGCMHDCIINFSRI